MMQQAFQRLMSHDGAGGLFQATEATEPTPVPIALSQTKRADLMVQLSSEDMEGIENALRSLEQLPADQINEFTEKLVNNLKDKPHLEDTLALLEKVDARRLSKFADKIVDCMARCQDSRSIAGVMKVLGRLDPLALRSSAHFRTHLEKYAQADFRAALSDVHSVALTNLVLAFKPNTKSSYSMFTMFQQPQVSLLDMFAQEFMVKMASLEASEVQSVKEVLKRFQADDRQAFGDAMTKDLFCGDERKRFVAEGLFFGMQQDVLKQFLPIIVKRLDDKSEACTIAVDLILNRFDETDILDSSSNILKALERNNSRVDLLMSLSSKFDSLLQRASLTNPVAVEKAPHGVDSETAKVRQEVTVAVLAFIAQFPKFVDNHGERIADLLLDPEPGCRKLAKQKVLELCNRSFLSFIALSPHVLVHWHDLEHEFRSTFIRLLLQCLAPQMLDEWKILVLKGLAKVNSPDLLYHWKGICPALLDMNKQEISPFVVEFDKVALKASQDDDATVRSNAMEWVLASKVKADFEQNSDLAEMIASRLEEQEDAKRDHAYRRLRAIASENPDVFEVLAKAIARRMSHAENDVRRAALDLISMLDGEIQEAFYGSYVADLIKRQDNSVELQTKGLETISRFANLKRLNLFDALVASLSHQEAAVRVAALSVVEKMETSDLNHKTLVKAIQQCWKDEDPKLRAGSYRLLAKLELNDKVVASAIEQGLKDDSHHVRLAVLGSLAAIGKGDPSKVELHSTKIAELVLDDMDEKVREAATDTLSMSPERILFKYKDNIKTLLKKETPPGLLAAAIWFLRKLPLDERKIPQYSEVIGPLLDARDSRVRWAAIDFMSDMQPKKRARYAALVAKSLCNSGTQAQDEEAWLAALRFLHVLCEEVPSILVNHQRAVANSLYYSSSRVRLAGLRLLNTMQENLPVEDDYNVIEICKGGITALLKDEDTRVKAEAALTLCWLDSPGPERTQIADVLLSTFRKYAARSYSGEDRIESTEFIDGICRHKGEFVTCRDGDGNTPLHIAAENGLLEGCKQLVEACAIVQARNHKGERPIDLALQCHRRLVVHYLQTLNAGIGEMRGGTGDALHSALADTNPVQEVEWITVDMPGDTAKRAGIQHSFLKVKVGADDEEATTYVIEKAAPDDNSKHGSQIEAGVFVSRWSDVAKCVADCSRFRHLTSSDLGPDTMTIKSLWEAAKEMGDYDVATCNCHHAALKMYNMCAKASKEVKEREMPNANWTSTAAAASKMFGANALKTFTSTQSCEGALPTSFLTAVDEVEAEGNEQEDSKPLLSRFKLQSIRSTKVQEVLDGLKSDSQSEVPASPAQFQSAKEFLEEHAEDFEDAGELAGEALPAIKVAAKLIKKMYEQQQTTQANKSILETILTCFKRLEDVAKCLKGSERQKLQAFIEDKNSELEDLQEYIASLNAKDSEKELREFLRELQKDTRAFEGKKRTSQRASEQASATIEDHGSAPAKCACGHEFAEDALFCPKCGKPRVENPSKKCCLARCLDMLRGGAKASS